MVESESAVLEVRRRYRTLFEAIADGFCIAEIVLEGDRPVDYRFIETNRAFEEHTGLFNAVGKTALELLPELEPFWIETYGRVALTGEPARFEQGSATMGRYFEVYASRLGPPDRREVAIFFKDITLRKQSERREAFFRALDDAVRVLNDPAEITHAIAKPAGEFLEVDRCAHADVAPDQDTFTILGNYTAGLPSIIGQYRLSDFGDEVLRRHRRGEAYVVADVESDAIAGPDLAAYRATGIRAVISVPLLKDGRLVAGMAVHMARPRAWTSGEVLLLETVASRCWESIQRARAARELESSEAELRALAEAVPCIVWICEPDGYLTYLNARWTELTGRSVEDSLAFAWAEALRPDDRAPVLERWRKCTETGEVYEGECRYKIRDGSYRSHLFRGVPVYDRDGRVRRWYGASLDIQNLRDADRRFSEMADLAPAMLWVTEPDGACSFLSRGWYEFTGQSQAEGLGFGWLKATHPDDLEPSRRIFLEANAKHVPFSFEYRLRRADGAYRWAIDAARPRFGDNGEFLGLRRLGVRHHRAQGSRAGP